MGYAILMATRVTGWEAISFAQRNQCLLSVHAAPAPAPAPAEEARDGVTVEEAKRVAATQPERVYLDFDEPGGDTRLA